MLKMGSVVRQWVRKRLAADGMEHPVADYWLEHLDAGHKIAEREHAKARLMGATDDTPYGILNVGIFGEGVDAPSLSAVGFLEARKSPVDVIQAVGRVMRRSPEKIMGYIICPILIPPNVDAEMWLRTHGPQDGWRELGQILLALRAHDSRIEDELSDLMDLYLPPPPMTDVATMVTLGGDDRRARHYGHIGKIGSVEGVVETVLTGKARAKDVLVPVVEVFPKGLSGDGRDMSGSLTADRIVSGKVYGDGSIEMREAAVVCTLSKSNRGGIVDMPDIDKSKKTARKMLAGDDGQTIDRSRRAEDRQRKAEKHIGDLFTKVQDVGITANLLARSGLARNRAERDVNILEDSIAEATRCLKEDELDSFLDRHFQLDHLNASLRQQPADGCTIASLLLMNAFLLHQRIAAGGWLPKVSPLDGIKSAPDTVALVGSQWNRIARHDFRPVMEPALEIIEEVLPPSGRTTGINRALRHLAGEAERIAESYADLGADHAGPLFNKVMGNQDSDGAFFTRPPAAALLARLILDVATPDADWMSDSTWMDHRSVDLACGSGTLLAALLTDMKRRAKEQGASKDRQAQLQKLAVEEVIAGLDFNDVSLQLAAAQLIAGNRDVVYRKMQLHRMPYGPQEATVKVGSLELLGQSALVPKDGQMHFSDEALGTAQVQMMADDPLLDEAVAAVRNVRIVIMNPPFSSREKMGRKFQKDIQRRMHKKADELYDMLVASDPDMDGFTDKNTFGPFFVALAEKCLDPVQGVLAMINPTIACTATFGQNERIVLARRFHIHTLLTCHRPKDIHLSQETSINESMILAHRHTGPRPPTRVISLDRFPLDDSEAAELHGYLSDCREGYLPKGWGEVSKWPADRIERGDWSAAAFRAPALANAAARMVTDKALHRLCDQKVQLFDTGRVLREKFQASSPGIPGSFPILKSKGAKGQMRIKGAPDEYWIPKTPIPHGDLIEETDHPDTRKLLAKAGHLLVTNGQRMNTGRLTAVACEETHVGNGWFPANGLTLTQAQAVAVFLNSTVGRLQLMRNPGMTLDFPTYSVRETANLKVPNVNDGHIIEILAECWHATADMDVPQFCQGECDVRRLWDEAVAVALKWNPDELSELRHLLHDEPHVRNLGRDQYGD